MHPGEGAAGSEPSLASRWGGTQRQPPPLPGWSFQGEPGWPTSQPGWGPYTRVQGVRTGYFTQPPVGCDATLERGVVSFSREWPEAEACSLPPSLRFTQASPWHTELLRTRRGVGSSSGTGSEPWPPEESAELGLLRVLRWGLPWAAETKCRMGDRNPGFVSGLAGFSPGDSACPRPKGQPRFSRPRPCILGWSPSSHASACWCPSRSWVPVAFCWPVSLTPQSPCPQALWERAALLFKACTLTHQESALHP